MIFFPASQFHPETYLPNPDLWQAKYCVSTKGGNWAIAMFKVKFLWWVNLLFYEPTLQLMNLNHIFVCSVIVLTHIVIWVGLNLEYRQILIAYQFIIICASKSLFGRFYGYTLQPRFKAVAEQLLSCARKRSLRSNSSQPAPALQLAKIFLGSWVPSGNLTQLWKITIFNGKNHYKWPFSIAMLNYQRVIWTYLNPSKPQKKPCKNFSEMGRCQKNFRSKSQKKWSARLPIQGFSSNEDISRTWGFSLSWNWPSRTGDSTTKTGEALPEMDFTNILPSLVFTTPRAPGSVGSVDFGGFHISGIWDSVGKWTNIIDRTSRDSNSGTTNGRNFGQPCVRE